MGLGLALPVSGFEVTTTFSPLVSGSDPMGLDGSTFTVTFTVDDSGVYLNDDLSFGSVIAPISGATLTISGASVPANNGTFSLNANYSLLGGIFGAAGQLLSPSTAVGAVGTAVLGTGTLEDSNWTCPRWWQQSLAGPFYPRISTALRCLPARRSVSLTTGPIQQPSMGCHRGL